MRLYPRKYIGPLRRAGPELDSQVGRLYFARSPTDGIAVCFYGLPESGIMGTCPPSPAAALSMLPTGTSTMVMCASARSRSAPAFRLTKIRGVGIAGSIPAVTRENVPTVPLRPSTKPAPTSRQRGECLSNRTEADFQAWRDERDWTARKYATWRAGERLPSQKRSSLMRCPCGEIFDSHRLENTVIHVPHMTAAQA
jgi:hypothetical protein